MPADELIGKLMGDAHGRRRRESVAWLCRELMEAEVLAQVGASHGEPTRERLVQFRG